MCEQDCRVKTYFNWKALHLELFVDGKSFCFKNKTQTSILAQAKCSHCGRDTSLANILDLLAVSVVAS